MRGQVKWEYKLLKDFLEIKVIKIYHYRRGKYQQIALCESSWWFAAESVSALGWTWTVTNKTTPTGTAQTQRCRKDFSVSRTCPLLLCQLSSAKKQCWHSICFCDYAFFRAIVQFGARSVSRDYFNSQDRNIKSSKESGISLRRQQPQTLICWAQMQFLSACSVEIWNLYCVCNEH